MIEFADALFVIKIANSDVSSIEFSNNVCVIFQ